MFPLGVALLNLGYAAVYTGIANILNGGNGPTFAEALGFNRKIAPPGAEKPNLTGQVPNVSSMSGSRPIGGMAR